MKMILKTTFRAFLQDDTTVLGILQLSIILRIKILSFILFLCIENAS